MIRWSARNADGEVVSVPVRELAGGKAVVADVADEPGKGHGQQEQEDQIE